MKKSFLFPLALALAGCETTVDVAPPPHTPRLALTYTLSNQAPGTADYRQFFEGRALYVSTSQDVFNPTKLQGRADATVELRDAAGQVVEQFRPRSRPGYPDSLRGYYAPTRGYVGRPGQGYTLRASAPGVAAVEAAMTLPAPAAVEAGSYAPKPLPPGSSPNFYNYSGRLSFTVPDNAATTDYYLAYARVLDAAGRPWGQVQPDYSARGNDGPDLKLNRFDLSQPNSSYETFPLSDAGRNGQRLGSSSDVRLSYNGGYDPRNPTPPAPAFIEIIVSSIPADTYRFYLSVLRYNDTRDNPFAEPAPLHSNVTPGYGLFGGAADVSFRIPL